MFRIDSGTGLDNLRSDIKQDDADAANNYVTYHGQNFVVGEEDYNADVFADDSTAKLVIKANGSARIGDADGGIQMDQNSNVSINLASPEANYRLSVNGSTRIDIEGGEVIKVTDGADSRLVMQPTGLIKFVGSGTETDPRSQMGAAGDLTLGSDLLIKKLHINDDTTFYVDSANGNTIIGNDTDNSGTLRVHSNTQSTSYANGAAIIDGGLGVDGNINSNGNIIATGNAEFEGGTLDVNDNGTNRFKVNTDGNIDIAGVTGYFTPTGGRKWVAVTTNTTLVSNTNYYVTSVTGSQVTLTLPSSPATGDQIRVLDVTDILTYNKSILISAPGSTPIQGDSAGDLLIQTPGAGLGLLYINALYGWRLIEL